VVSAKRYYDRKFNAVCGGVLCWLPVVAIAASDDPKELERLLAKVQSEPLILLLPRVSQTLRSWLHRVDRWAGQI